MCFLGSVVRSGSEVHAESSNSPNRARLRRQRARRDRQSKHYESASVMCVCECMCMLVSGREHMNQVEASMNQVEARRLIDRGMQTLRRGDAAESY